MEGEREREAERKWLRNGRIHSHFYLTTRFFLIHFLQIFLIVYIDVGHCLTNAKTFSQFFLFFDLLLLPVRNDT